MPPPTTMTAPTFSDVFSIMIIPLKRRPFCFSSTFVSVRCLFNHFDADGSLKAVPSVREVEDRHVILFTIFPGNFFLPCIQVRLTHRAPNNDTISPRLFCHIQELSYKILSDVRMGKGSSFHHAILSCTTVFYIGSQHCHQLIHLLRVFRIFRIGNLGRSGNQASMSSRLYSAHSEVSLL